MSSDLDASMESSLRTFVTRQRTLLSREREAEIERTSLLLTNCTPKLLEQKGLALGNLGVVSAGIGLGGKTCVLCLGQTMRNDQLSQEVQITRTRASCGISLFAGVSTPYVQVESSTCTFGWIF